MLITALFIFCSLLFVGLVAYLVRAVDAMEEIAKSYEDPL